jgi:trans-2,3-dihydro-3-hydroxyanthranilate isomerase
MLQRVKSYRYLHLDVFTGHLFGGNQLAVVLDGRGLRDAQMQAIAKEMNFSETTFVLPAERPDTDVRVRIFTPGEELPMAGHPTIGTAFALARTGAIEPTQDRVVFGLGVGPTNVRLTWDRGALTFAWMTQLAPDFGSPIDDRATIAAALRLRIDGLASGLPVQTISCGVPYVMVPIATRAAVDQASLDGEVYSRLLRNHGIAPNVAVYLFSTEHGFDDAVAYSRMFAPGLGIVEDPATGSACGPLGCYLVRHGLVALHKAAAMVNRQGVHMGRPSDIHIAIAAEGGDITGVHVGGEAVLAGEGTLYID